MKVIDEQSNIMTLPQFHGALRLPFGIDLRPIASGSAAFSLGSMVIPVLMLGTMIAANIGLPLTSFLLGSACFICRRAVSRFLPHTARRPLFHIASFIFGIFTTPFSTIFTGLQIIPGLLVFYSISGLAQLLDVRFYERAGERLVPVKEKLKQAANVVIFGAASTLSFTLMISNHGNILVLKILTTFFSLCCLYALVLSLAKKEPVNMENLYFTRSQAKLIRFTAIASAAITLLSGLLMIGHH
jgi:hypothetical protein